MKVLTSRALLPSLNKVVRLTINDVSSNSNVLYTDLHTKNTAIQASDKYLSHTTSLALSEEINEVISILSFSLGQLVFNCQCIINADLSRDATKS